MVILRDNGRVVLNSTGSEHVGFESNGAPLLTLTDTDATFTKAVSAPSYTTTGSLTAGDLTTFTSNGGVNIYNTVLSAFSIQPWNFRLYDSGQVTINAFGSDPIMFAQDWSSKLVIYPTYVQFNVEVRAPSTVTTSDDRAKFGEKPIANGLEIVRQLSPQTYNKVDGDFVEELTEDTETYKEAGIIAQELFDILPDAVAEGDETTPWTVNTCRTRSPPSRTLIGSCKHRRRGWRRSRRIKFVLVNDKVEGQDRARARSNTEGPRSVQPVSYTHLTLPTKRIV